MSVAGGYDRRYIVCVGGVCAFDEPETFTTDLSRSRPTARLRHGATVMVVAQQRDWLKVCPSLGGNKLVKGG